MKKLILTALDNNNSIWYEHLIPFILSLKETNYDGDIGVIAYHLLDSKREVLINAGIKVFEPTYLYVEILMDRQISAADIAEQYNYDIVALYDCDIWFPRQELTVFEQIKNAEKLYCSYDIWECGFLYDCVNQYGVENVMHKIKQNMAKNQYVWQAGVVIGYQQAWQKYRNYAISHLSRENDFYLTYGIDTTLLNLYAFDTDNIHYLPIKYNCPPAWGIRLNNYGYGIEYSFENELVEGLHVTRAHRKGGEYSYHQLFKEKYFQQGKSLQIKHYPDYSITKESIISHCINQDNETVKLALEHVYTNGVFNVAFLENAPFYPKNTLTLETAGTLSMRLKNNEDKTQRFIFCANSIINYEPCAEIYYVINNQRHKLEINQYHAIELFPNETIEFLIEELNVEGKRIRWVLPAVCLY